MNRNPPRPTVSSAGGLILRRLGCGLAVGLGVCWLSVHSAAADDGALESAKMTQRVDEILAARWVEEDVKPAARSSDAEFIRRVYLDLVGVIPRTSTVRNFLDDDQADKRALLIDRLLDSPRHATHMANTWRQIMLPGGADIEQFQSVAGIQNWLRKQFASNLRYDRLVSDFLVATGGGDAGPALYYTSLELKPEKLAASTSRIFLGLQIECAECHDHPFDHWKQQDFWGYAAFFAQLDQSQSMGGPRQTALIDLPDGEVKLPDTENVVLPKYPGGRAPGGDENGSRRVQLAIWMASRDNPFLPRAAVNRTWALLFGRGLVDPVDDLGEHNPPTHPAAMDELTDYFVASGFDLRGLLRVLANSNAYQLSSETKTEPPRELFSSMAVKTLTPDQLFDSLARVLSRPNANPAANGGFSFDGRRIAFTSRMRMQGANATEFDAGVLQALTLLNGTETAALTNVESSGILAALQAPWMTDQDRVEALFLATLSRRPTPNEAIQMVRHIAGSEHPTIEIEEGAERPEADRQRATSDLLWALLNSAEFELNH